ncbi:MAG: hypothetical protein CUN55_00985 [Phototrophicales bacterium]|nr:MAG: hypothetical protein CUN55_00985 [Phototrophicales bacterium]
MVRRYFIIVFIFSWFFIPQKADAQSVTWLAWTYDDLNGEMIQIDSSGFTHKSVILPKNSNDTYPYNVAVSPQGDRVAYTLTNSNGDVALYVYDLVGDVVLAQFYVPFSNAIDSLNFVARPEIFSPDGSQIAYAYAHQNEWMLSILDINSGGQVVLQTSQQFTGEIPVPMWFDGFTVHVTMVPLAAGGFTSLNSFAWDTLSNTWQTTDFFPVLNADIEPRTSEVIFPALDTRFNDRTNDMLGVGVHYNSVQVYAPNISPLPFPFYVDEINTIDAAYFIQNGERILLQTTQIDGDSYGALSVVERSGAVAGLLPYENLWIERIMDVGDGFVFSTSTTELERFFPTLSGVNSSAIVYVSTTSQIQGNLGQVVFTGIHGTNPRLVWAQDITNRNLPDTTSWGQVGVVSANPPQGVGLSDSFVIGDLARVTPEGNGLNLRDAPSINARTLRQLAEIEILEVVGGPQTADGFVWWQLSDGAITGWAAAGDTSNLWLEVYRGGSLPPPSEAPTLYSPSPNQFIDATTDAIVNFSWSDTPNAEQYALELDTCFTGSCTTAIAFYTNDPYYAEDLTKYGFGDYRWRVVAIDAVGNSYPSEYRNFTFVDSTSSVSPNNNAPILLSPQDGDTIYAFQLSYNGQTFPLVFEWQGMSNVSEYVLEFEDCSNGNCLPLIAFYTPDWSYSVNLFDFGYGYYRWRVVAANAASEWRYLTFTE